jgi:SET and MYND domain-containing protein
MLLHNLEVGPFGRRIVAKRDISAGSLLFEESAICAVIDDEHLNTHCSHCFGDNASSACGSCFILHYCNRDCQRKDWSIHKKECAGFLKCKPSRPDATVRVICRAIYMDQLNKSDLMNQLVTNREHASDQRLLELVPTVKMLKFILGDLLRSAKETIDLILLFSCNGMNICDGEMVNIGVGLFISACHINSACLPNAAVIFAGSKANVRTIRDIKSGEEIFITYLNPTTPRTKRVKELRDTYYFDCKCHLCTVDPDPLAKFQCSTKGCEGQLDEVQCVNCGQPLEIELVSYMKNDTLSLESYQKLASFLADTNSRMFEVRHDLIRLLMSQQKWKDAAKICQIHIAAYEEIFGQYHPLCSVYMFYVFKMQLFEQYPDIDYGKRCLKLMTFSHGSSHSLTKEVVKLLTLSQMEMNCAEVIE